jgi:uncharacterized membrane protein YqjE
MEESSLKQTGAAFLGLAGTRIELIGIELREEGLYVQKMIVRGIIAAFLLGGALVMAGVFIAAAFWDTHRLPALAAVAVLYAIAGGGALMALRSSLQQRPTPFHATAREFEADVSAIRKATGRRES